MIHFETIYSLSALYVGMYKKERVMGIKINYLQHIIDSVISKKVMLLIYRDLIKDKWLTPIEDLPTYEKQQLVNECRDTGLFFTNETLIRSAKILHTIKFINANS